MWGIWEKDVERRRWNSWSWMKDNYVEYITTHEHVFYDSS